MVEKAKEAYDKMLSQLTGLVNESMSLENVASESKRKFWK